MKFNRFGINLDEGLPLSEEALDKLYVPCFQSYAEKIKEWIEDDSTEESILLGGQIGSGKSTLLTKIFSDNNLKPDIKFQFDQESLNLDEGDFLSILLTGFIDKAIELELDLSFSKLPKELFGLEINDWKEVVNLLSPKEFSLANFENKVTARKKVTENSKYIIKVILDIGYLIKDNSKNAIYFFASGIDKFDTKSSSFISIKSTLEILSNFKTMFEVNALHLFLPDINTPFLHHPQKIFISSLNVKNVLEILVKRMGVYSQPIENELELIAKWSGGNPRQGIRILTHFQSMIKNTSIDRTTKLLRAIKKTTDDFFAYARKPSSNLIKTIEKDKKVETSLIYLPGDKETVQEALFGNWIFILQDSINGAWPASINPLVKPFFENENKVLLEPEQALLLQYAETYGTSSIGLDFNILEDDGSSKSVDKILHEYLSAEIENPLPLKLIEILDLINAALLSKDRKDRIMVGFKDRDILNAARAYIFAKANTYEYQKYNHMLLNGGKTENPIKSLEENLSSNFDIFSFEFEGEWTEQQLEALNNHRDNFISYQMIWWIPLENLQKYLPHWVQLRELFEFFILEDELLGSLSIEDIESDLIFFENLVETTESAESELVKNLKIVLQYLKEKRGCENG